MGKAGMNIHSCNVSLLSLALRGFIYFSPYCFQALGHLQECKTSSSILELLPSFTMVHFLMTFFAPFLQMLSIQRRCSIINTYFKPFVELTWKGIQLEFIYEAMKRAKIKSEKLVMIDYQHKIVSTHQIR